MSKDTVVDDAARIDLRSNPDRRRSEPDRRAKSNHVEFESRSGKARRQKPERRRQIDPTTCERDYTVAEIEFMTAMDHYRRESGRPFPTWSEVLEVLQSLGYEKVNKRPEAELSDAAAVNSPPAESSSDPPLNP